MPRRAPLDPRFAARPFTVAEARDAGIGRGRLSGADLARPFHGVRSIGEYSRLLAYAPRLRPGDRFSHTTSAEMWGAPVPERFRDLVHVTAAPGSGRPRGRGVIGHESSLSSTVDRSGLPSSDAATTFVELGTLLGVYELVAVGDHFVLDPRVLDPRDPRPYASGDELRAAIERTSSRGVGTARRALARVRMGVESPMETALRMLLEDAGLPRPECGYELRDDGGKSIGWFDLAWPAWRVIAEYDGDQHRTSTRQYERDIARFDAAADADWRVVRVRSSGILMTPAATVARVRRALERSGWHPARRKRS